MPKSELQLITLEKISMSGIVFEIIKLVVFPVIVLKSGKEKLDCKKITFCPILFCGELDLKFLDLLLKIMESLASSMLHVG